MVSKETALEVWGCVDGLDSWLEVNWHEGVPIATGDGEEVAQTAQGERFPDYSVEFAYDGAADSLAAAIDAAVRAGATRAAVNGDRVVLS